MENTLNKRIMVSVVMPVYNTEDYVEEAINSILSQTFCDFEFIIIDDGSTDNTLQLIKRFTDPRIKLIVFDKNKGNYPARNAGCRLAKGKYIAVMDADDIAHPDRLDIQVRFMEENPDVLASGGAYKISNSDLSPKDFPMEYEKIRYILMRGFCMTHPTLIINKNALENIGYYEENSLYAEDYNLIVRMVQKGVVVNIPNILLTRRLHKNQISEAHHKEQNEFSLKIQLRYQHEIGIYYPPRDKLFFLSQLAIYIHTNTSFILSNNLFYGKMGNIVFYYKYARYANNKIYTELADVLLDEVLTSISKSYSIDISTGLCGIGMAIGYILEEGFVEGDVDEILSTIDQFIESKTDFETEDWSFDTGIVGVFYYVIYRLNTSKQKNSIFTPLYLENIQKIANKLKNENKWIAPSIVFKCIDCLEGEIVEIDWTDFWQQSIFPLPTTPSVGQWSGGLRSGCVGWGIWTLLNI